MSTFNEDQRSLNEHGSPWHPHCWLKFVPFFSLKKEKCQWTLSLSLATYFADWIELSTIQQKWNTDGQTKCENITQHGTRKLIKQWMKIEFPMTYPQNKRGKGGGGEKWPKTKRQKKKKESRIYPLFFCSQQVFSLQLTIERNLRIVTHNWPVLCWMVCRKTGAFYVSNSTPGLLLFDSGSR